MLWIVRFEQARDFILWLDTSPVLACGTHLTWVGSCVEPSIVSAEFSEMTPGVQGGRRTSESTCTVSNLKEFASPNLGWESWDSGNRNN